jgi:hypothetical protein
MIRALLCNLTALAMALHLVLGCCWHHEHAGPRAASALAADHHHAACHESRDECGGERACQHAPNEPCDEEHCCFLGVDFVPRVKPVPPAAPGLAAAAQSLPVPASAFCDGYETPRTGGGAAGPPLYLLNRVWRI